MASHVSRRSLLGGCAAGLAELLLTRRIVVAGVVEPLAGEPGQLDLALSALAPSILRIAIAPVYAWASEEELGVVTQPGAALLLHKPDPTTADLPWGKYRIAVEEKPLRVTVSLANGNVCQRIQFEPDSTAVRFEIGDAPLFGLGEGLPSYDLRGVRDGMRNGEGTPHLDIDGARLPIPWLISAGGWGLFVGQPSGFFDLTGPTGVFQPVEAFSSRNVYLVLGDTPAEILRGYAELTGYPHLPPLWSLGYQQSHRTLASRDEVMSEAQTFREKKLPCDTLIYLGTGFCPSGWNTDHGSFTYNADVFPDPKTMLDQLHAEHFKVVLHVVPPGDFHGTIRDTGAEAKTPGDAVTYWQEHLPVEETGVDGWWPDEGDRLSVYERFQRNQLYWDGPVSVHPERRPFALNRNGYAGLQRFGWLWSGDIDSNWASLTAQVRNGINVGLCGIPYWGTDTGGFTPTRELTPELYVRWFQFSAFCPLFRSHGRAWKLRLPWGWNTGNPGPLEGAERLGPNWPPEDELRDARVEEICREYLNLRYRLLPYLYSSVAQTHETGLPLMRPLWLACPEDKQALLRDDEYLFGDSFLVAPVLRAGTSERAVYLPRGTWWEFWSGAAVAGGQQVSRAVDLKTMPLYVKAGAVVPLGPVKQYTTEPVEEPLTLRVYPGADGNFVLYEDDGESFRYRRGEFTRIHCTWQDADRTLALRVDPKGKPASGRQVQVEIAGGHAPVTVTLQGPVTEAKF
ncbi:MAG TPA: TIM-barrel domain-containing protein [Acidobacteriaceae bacterium]|nr:TIM-barrel domain-containing protein [Acidobacteriaceae bacterium]